MTMLLFLYTIEDGKTYIGAVHRMPTAIYFEEHDRSRRLRELGLDRPRLIEVVRAMVAARADTTDNNARSAPGYRAWDAGVCSLRQQYCGDGWEREVLNGIETIRHPELRIRVTPVNADEGVCCRDSSPCNRAPKGPATGKVIDLNGQMELFPDDPKGRPAKHHDGYSFWQLLVYDDGNAVRAELSRPIEFDGSYFIAFSERIFLIENGDWDAGSVSPSGEGEDDDIDVDVRRKS